MADIFEQLGIPGFDKENFPESGAYIEENGSKVIENIDKATDLFLGANATMSSIGVGNSENFNTSMVAGGVSESVSPIISKGASDEGVAINDETVRVITEVLEPLKQENPDAAAIYNDIIKQLEEANGAAQKAILEYHTIQAKIQEEADKKVGTQENIGLVTRVASAAAGAIFGPAFGGLVRAGLAGVRATADARARRSAEAAEQAAAAIAAALAPNENYLNLSFREQCYIQKNVYSLIEIRNSSTFPKRTILPYVGDNKKNCSIMCGGDPYAFMNRLTQPTSVSGMFDIPGYILSSLQPTVRLYKVIMDEEGKTQDEIEITFPGTTTQDEIKKAFMNKNARGYGIGLKSFEWTLEGSDPFAAKRMISARLSIHATTFSEILKDRRTPGGTFKYADLALRTGTTKDKKENDPAECFTDSADVSYDGSYDVNFRLKAVVGYAIPDNLNISRKLSETERTKYQKAVSACYSSYDLIPTIHEFSFEDDGRVLLNIDYQAYIQDYFDASYFDIFSDDNKITRDIFKNKIEKKIKSARRKEANQKPSEEQEDANAIRKLKTDNMKILLTKLFKADKVYYYNIPYEELNTAMSNAYMPPFYNSENVILNEESVRNELAALQNKLGTETRPEAQQDIKRKIDDIEKQLDQDSDISSTANKAISSATHRQVTMFFLYDLIDIILEGIDSSFPAYEQVLNKLGEEYKKESDERIIKLEKENLKRAIENFKKLRVLLGPIEIRNPANNNEYTHVSIGEIPISVKYFSEWMADKMLTKDRRSYNLASFIDAFIKNYVSVFLNDKTCGGVKTTQPVQFHSTTVVSYGDPKSDNDEISELIKKQNENAPADKVIDMWCSSARSNVRDPDSTHDSILNVQGDRAFALSGNGGHAKQKNWMVYYAGRSSPTNTMTADRGDDQVAGINHYVLGQSSGIVKNIKLEKTSTPMLKEMRYEQEGYDGLMQLREIYNANIDMFLYPSVYPGTIIFVDPRGFAPDLGTGEYETKHDDYDKNQSIDRFEITRYGVGGYYMVTKASHRIAEGERTTQLQCIWLNGIMKSPRPPDGEKLEDQTSQSSMRKCGATEQTNSVCKLVLEARAQIDQVGQQQT
jgi:hypothetical protein